MQEEQHPPMPEFGLKIIDRYVAREFLVGYVIAIAVVLSLRVLLDFFVMFDEFVESKPGQDAPGALQVIGYVFGYYGPKILEYFRDFSGSIIVLAAAFSLARMTRQNELTAILASGISLKRVIAPVVLLGILLSALMVVDQEIVLPRLADKLARRHDEMAQLRAVPVWFLPDPNITLIYDHRQYNIEQQLQASKKEALLCAQRYDPQSQAMSNMLVILRRKGQLTGQITADQATWDPLRQNWELINGRYTATEGASNENYGNYLVVPVSRYQSELTADFLALQRHSNYKSLMSRADLNNLLRRPLQPLDWAEAISEKHFRFTDFLISIVMLLLSLPLLVSREKRNTRTAIGFALLGSGGCFVVTFVCKLLAGAALDPLLAAWMPIIIFLPLSVIALDAIKT